MATYRISHETDYHYTVPVPHSQQLLHLQPRLLPWQRIVSHWLHITPPPSREKLTTDFFGNPSTFLEFTQPHLRLSVSSETHIEVRPRQWPVFSQSPAWERVVEHCRYAGHAIDDGLLAALVFRHESPFVRIKHVFSDYAAECFTPERPLLEAANALMLKINDEFTFDAEATQIATPLLQVLEEKRGVCQDFAHLMIACLRALGLPARYVSGYLLTQPPPGQERLIGADASHAWVSLYCPSLSDDAARPVVMRQGMSQQQMAETQMAQTLMVQTQMPMQQMQQHMAQQSTQSQSQRQGGAEALIADAWIDFDPTNAVLPGEEHITLAWGRDFSDVSPLRGVILGGGQPVLDVRVTVMPAD
ncbi:MAG: transglutaminase family protein [Moraxellaceae bacterium]